MNNSVVVNKDKSKEIHFLSTSFWSLISVLSRLSSRFVLAKLIAVFAGVAAYGLIGQFLSFVNLVQIFAGGIIRSGMTKYSSEYHDNPDYLTRLVSTSFKFTLSASLICGLVIVCLSTQLSSYVFLSPNYSNVIALFGLTLFGYALNQLYLSLFKGLNQMRAMALLSVIGGLFSVALVGLGCYYAGVNGALYGFVASQFFVFMSAVLFSKNVGIGFSWVRMPFDTQVAKKLMCFSAMSIVSMISIPFSEVIIRLYVANHTSWVNVGYWQAMTRISDAYLLIAMNVISNYALPKYSRIHDIGELRKEVYTLIAKLLPIVSFMALSIFLLRDFVILTLFTKAFLPMRHLFGYQLLGDVAKTCSFIIGNVLIAKARIKVFIVFELVTTSVYFIGSIMLFNYLGIVGLPIAFMITYSFQLLINVLIFQRYVMT